MQLNLDELTQLAEISKKLSNGYHISEQDFALWQELDQQEDSYTALFGALGNNLKRDSRGFFYFEVDDAKVEAERLKGLGVKLVQDVYHLQMYGWIATFEDADGNYFQIVQISAS